MENQKIDFFSSKRNEVRVLSKIFDSQPETTIINGLASETPDFSFSCEKSKALNFQEAMSENLLNWNKFRETNEKIYEEMQRASAQKAMELAVGYDEIWNAGLALRFASRIDEEESRSFQMIIKKVAIMIFPKFKEYITN